MNLINNKIKIKINSKISLFLLVIPKNINFRVVFIQKFLTFSRYILDDKVFIMLDFFTETNYFVSSRKKS